MTPTNLSANPKFQEALDHMKAAEKAMATSFFKRKPDYDTAASEYESAATTFKYIKAYDESIQALLKASAAQYQSESYYMAAKSMENAAQLAVQHLKRIDDGVQFYERSCKLYRQNNNIERAIEVLEKAAKSLEPTNPERALPFYEEACALYDDEERGMVAVETYKKTIGLYLKLKQSEKALKMTYRLSDILFRIQNRNLLFKNYTSAVILLLMMGDEVEAGKRFDEYVGQQSAYPSSDEGRIANDLLAAFERRNQDMVKEVIKRQHLGFLDPEIVKAGRSLKVIGAEALLPAPPTNMPPEQSTALCDDDAIKGVPDQAPKEETDELC